MPIIKKCLKCGKEFRIKPSRVKKGRGKYCSRKCFCSGKRIDSFGYVRVIKREHPFCTKQGYVREHRLIMEKHIGRYLLPEEVVHHRGTKYPLGSIQNKQDNRIENLELFRNNSEHTKEHLLISHPRQKKYNTKNRRMCNICKKIKELNNINFYKCRPFPFGFGYTCKYCDKIHRKMRN